MSLNSPIPNDLTISFYLLKNCKLWVWDFDDTIIDTTTYLKKSMQPCDIRNRTDQDLDKETPQWRYFKKLVEYLVMHGRYVAIASFGTLEIIQAYMDRIMGFNQQFFNKRNIMAPCMKDREVRTFQPPQNKNEYIYQLMKIYRVQDFKRVVLFDDLPSNIADATGIGIIAVQIAAPRNGDSDINKMYFGPWVMDDFDRKMETQCGTEIYLNRTFTGISSKSRLAGSNGSGSERQIDDSEAFLGISYDKIDFGLGQDEWKFGTTAYGSSIGDRKVSVRPDMRWNRMNVQNPPQWVDGNWNTDNILDSKENNINKVGNSTAGWEDSSLGGSSHSFWEKHQRVRKAEVGGRADGGSRGSGSDDSSSGSSGKRISWKSGGGSGIRYGTMDNDDNGDNGDNGDNSDVVGISEGFENKKNSNSNRNGNSNSDRNSNREESCSSCNKIGWNWITLTLMVVIFFMAVLVVSVM